MNKKITFYNHKKEKLSGILTSREHEVNHPIVIMAHGFFSNKDSKTYIQLASRLNEMGIDSFRFDFSARGESAGDTEDITISKGIEEILIAIRYVKILGYKKIGLFGTSFGGNCAYIATAKSDDVSCLVLKSPVSDYYEKKRKDLGQTGLEEIKKAGYFMYSEKNGNKVKILYNYISDSKNNISYDFSDEVECPVLIIHGDNDHDVDISQSKKLDKMTKNSELKVIEGADHNYQKIKDFNKVLELSSNFFKNNML